jgi:hypothetical protein
VGVLKKRGIAIKRHPVSGVAPPVAFGVSLLLITGVERYLFLIDHSPFPL